ncbi:hypothetical protein HDU67_007105 [Dinochytrium kinnereticum]|nr:hypothetical protein HDU67_007105 [Dinochytrium kinnereticum]
MTSLSHTLSHDNIGLDRSFLDKNTAAAVAAAVAGAAAAGDDDKSNRRKRISLACDDCKRRKYKCDGVRPVCGACVKSELSCHYTPRPGNKNLAPPKPKGPRALHAAYLRERIMQLEFKAAQLNIDFSKLYGSSRLGYNDEEDNSEEETNAAEGHARQHPSLSSLGSSPSQSFVARKGYPIAHPTSSGRGARAGVDTQHGSGLDNQRAVIHPTTPPPEAQRSQAMCRCEECQVDRSFCPEGGSSPVIPREALKELIELWFACHYHVDPLPMFHRITFVRSLSSSTPPSPLLLHAMYATAAPYSRHPSILNKQVSEALSHGDAADFDRPKGDRYSVGEGFYGKARSLVMHYIETPSLSTVQALVLISHFSMVTGRMTAAWQYLSMAIDMALTLNLNVDPEVVCPDLSVIEKDVRRRTFWVCYMQDSGDNIKAKREELDRALDKWFKSLPPLMAARPVKDMADRFVMDLSIDTSPSFMICDAATLEVARILIEVVLPEQRILNHMNSLLPYFIFQSCLIHIMIAQVPNTDRVMHQGCFRTHMQIKALDLLGDYSFIAKPLATTLRCIVELAHVTKDGTMERIWRRRQMQKAGIIPLDPLKARGDVYDPVLENADSMSKSVSVAANLATDVAAAAALAVTGDPLVLGAEPVHLIQEIPASSALKMHGPFPDTGEFKVEPLPEEIAISGERTCLPPENWNPGTWVARSGLAVRNPSYENQNPRGPNNGDASQYQYGGANNLEEPNTHTAFSGSNYGRQVMTLPTSTPDLDSVGSYDPQSIFLSPASNRDIYIGKLSSNIDGFGLLGLPGSVIGSSPSYTAPSPSLPDTSSPAALALGLSAGYSQEKGQTISTFTNLMNMTDLPNIDLPMPATLRSAPITSAYPSPDFDLRKGSSSHDLGIPDVHSNVSGGGEGVTVLTGEELEVQESIMKSVYNDVRAVMGCGLPDACPTVDLLSIATREDDEVWKMWNTMAGEIVPMVFGINYPAYADRPLFDLERNYVNVSVAGTKG